MATNEFIEELGGTISHTGSAKVDNVAVKAAISMHTARLPLEVEWVWKCMGRSVTLQSPPGVLCTRMAVTDPTCL